MMKYKGYLGRVEFDEKAAILHGEVVGIRDVVTFQAKSAAKVEKAFRESVDDYLAFCKLRKEEPNKPFTGNFVVRIGESLHRQLAALAKYNGVSLNAQVEELLNKSVSLEMKDDPVDLKPVRSKNARRKQMQA